MKNSAVLVITIGALSGTPGFAGSFGSYADTPADNVVVPYGSGNVFQLTSPKLPSGYSYAGLYWLAPSGFTLNNLQSLSADYEMAQGGFYGGAPRFSIGDAVSGQEAWVYWGTPSGGGAFADPNVGSTSLNNTGNFALSSDVRVYNNGFGGQNSPNTGETWSQFVAAAGTGQIDYISLDLDAGWAGTQQLLVNNFEVNSTTYGAGFADTLSAPAPVPLPAAAGIGLSMLGGFGALAGLRKRLSRKARIA